MSALTIEPRHRWRQRAEAAGLRVAFGGPTPEGRHLVLRVVRGKVIAERDESARWRGHVLISETPAALTPDERSIIHAAAVRFAPPDSPVDLDLAWDGDEAVLIGARLASLEQEQEQAQSSGVQLTAYVTADAVYHGPLTELVLPTAAASPLALGQALHVTRGDQLATLTVAATTRDLALLALAQALSAVQLNGPLTNLARLRSALPLVQAGLGSARALDALDATPCAIEVLAAGLLTTVQDWPGRLGHWAVGVPPSGPFDDFAFRLANRLVGNPPDAAGLELTLLGPTLRFHQTAIVCLTGGARRATLNGEPLPLWKPVAIAAGGVLACGAPDGPGCRGYLAVRHGLAVPTYLGSRATFDLGGFGGHAGRGLKVGDLLPLTRAAGPDELAACPAGLPVAARPTYSRQWTVGVLEGPHPAPEFFTPIDMATLYAHPWEVHHNSNRTGIRLIGPKPQWARRDGGEAGLHPSNIHDNAYAVGAIDFTGDMPILLGPDGPSLGGFVCPAVVVDGERWKLGQLRPGDTVQFRRLTPGQAAQAAAERERIIAELTPGKRTQPTPRKTDDDDPGAAILLRREDLCLRRAGDRYLLVEFGDLQLDLALRMRVHQLWQALTAEKTAGIIDLTPGIRSLQIHFAPDELPLARLIALVLATEDALPPIDAVEVPMRTVHLPLSWDDPATRKAIEIYMRSVNPTAPWCPSNLEFIRRINGLDSLEAVKRIVFAAEYLVLGLGDVYLGAPVATPFDPRHRLVTTKYNPARTWTPQNAVGIGGAYMCVYGMEGPGGYQFVGRTVPIWDTWGSEPCTLRFFDRIRFFPVTAEELLELRAKPYVPRTEDGVFRWADYQRFLVDNETSIAAFRTTQRTAFQAERQRWSETAP